MKVLLFRTASDGVINQLLEELMHIEKISIEGFAQHSAVEKCAKKYPTVKWIDSGVEIFSEDAGGVELIENTFYDEIYIPCSTQRFTNFENIFFLLEHLSYEKVILYDCNGKRKQMKKRNSLAEIIKYMESCLLVSFFTLMYKIKCNMN